MTKKLKRTHAILGLLSLLLNVAPLAVYVIRGLILSDAVYQKLALSCTIIVVAILTAVALVNKIALRSRLWILLIGIYICLDSMITPLIIIAVCQTVDELIVCPLRKHYGARLLINKEIDRRG